MDLYEKRAGDRDRFEILAFHDASVDSFEQLDKELAPLIDEEWRGRSLPFPVLLDSTGETFKKYGIRFFPTVILIDPEGIFVGQANAESLAQKLDSAA